MKDKLSTLPEIKSLKQVKKFPRQMPFDSLVIDSILNTNASATTNSLSEISLLDENTNIRHLVGRYERYFWDEKTIVRDILNIKPNGHVIIKSVKGILEGEADYSLNSILTIRINTFNDTPFPEQLSCFVGRHSFQQIICLHTLAMSINANNVPFVRHEVLVPIPEGAESKSEIFVPESLNYFKIEKKYPELLKYINTRNAQSFNRVEW